MAKNKKKKRKYPRPDKKLLIFSAVVLAVAALYGTTWAIHNHAITEDKSRFARAGNDVETVADAVVAAVGQPSDRKDGGKCSYAHQEFTKGPLSCEVYSYLAYGVNSPGEVNTIVQKVDALPALHGNPWKFKAVTEKPHQFATGVNYSDTFVGLQSIFDTETKSESYSDNNLAQCAVIYTYQNTVYANANYPKLNVSSPQLLIVDLGCDGLAQSNYFPLQQ